MSKPHKHRPAWRWATLVTILSLIFTFSLSLLPGAFTEQGSVAPALAALLLFVALGVIFDMLGVAVASVSEKPFRAMSARRVHGSTQALWLIVRADRVVNFCCDVVGDICGVISGAACPVIAVALWKNLSLMSVLLSAATAALMVGGKALGKSIAMQKNTQIVLFAGRILWFFGRKHRDI